MAQTTNEIYSKIPWMYKVTLFLNFAEVITTIVIALMVGGILGDKSMKDQKAGTKAVPYLVGIGFTCGILSFVLILATALFKIGNAWWASIANWVLALLAIVLLPMSITFFYD